jgi:tetratricopeptide (TPR) repeat protein
MKHLSLFVLMCLFVSQTEATSTDKRPLFDYYFQQALTLREQGKYAESFELYRFCTEIDSLDPQPWYELSNYYRSLELPDISLKMLEKAYSLAPENEWYAFGLASMYMSLNRLPDAIKLYETLVANRHEDENLMYQLAGLYEKTGNYKKALKLLNTVERIIGKNESVALEKYKILKETGSVKKAIKEIESLRDEYPYDVDYTILLGDAWLDLNDPKKAYQVYMIARNVDPGNPAINLSLADYYNTIGDSLAAVNQLSLALTNPDTDVDTKLSILKPMLDESVNKADTAQILTYFKKLIDQHPDEYQIRELYVQWLLSRGQKQTAKDELRTLLDLNPNELEAWKSFLELNLESNNQSVIRSVCSQALLYFPRESVFWFYLGLGYTSAIESGEKDSISCQKALYAFKQAAEVSPESDLGLKSRILGLTADTYLIIDDTVKAFDYYEKALVAYPGNLLVLNNYAYFLSVSGRDLSKAERMSRKTIEADPKNATFLDTFAWIFFQEGQYSLAKIYIERALSNESEPGIEMLEHYGDILWFNNDSVNARVQWEKAVKLKNPSESLLKKAETGQYTK